MKQIQIFKAILLLALTFFGKNISAQSDSVWVSTGTTPNAWLIYDAERKVYLPYLKHIHKAPKALHIIVEQDTVNRKALGFSPGAACFLFVNNRLRASLADSARLFFDKDSLISSVGESQVLMSFYYENHAQITQPGIVEEYVLSAKQLQQNRTKESQEDSFLEEEPLIPQPKADHTVRDRLFLISLALLTLWAFVVNRFFPVFGIRAFFRSLEIIRRPKLNNIRLDSSLFTASALFQSTAIGFCILVLSLYFDLPNTSVANTSSMQQTVGLFLLFSLFGFIFFLIRYLFIRFPARLFFNSIWFAEQHFLLYLFSSGIFYGFLSLCCILLTTLKPSLFGHEADYFLYIIPLLVSVRIVFTAIRLNKLERFRNLYFISYLCGTEILPIFLVIKLLLSF